MHGMIYLSTSRILALVMPGHEETQAADGGHTKY